jgi:hypothetical protein
MMKQERVDGRVFSGDLLGCREAAKDRNLKIVAECEIPRAKSDGGEVLVSSKCP